MRTLQPYFRRRPRLAADRIERCRVAHWFERTASHPVRIVCGPLGSGKSTAVLQYVDGRDGATGYVRVPSGTNAAAVLAMLDTTAFEEIVLDEIDRAEPAALEALIECVLDSVHEPRLVLVGRSRRALHAQALIARGYAASFDAAALAFDEAEAARLARALGVCADAQSVAQLIYDTDGWAIAVEWLVRDAAEGGRSLDDAFTHWRERNGHVLLEFVEQERHHEADAAAFRRLVDGAWSGEQDELSRLEQLGFPVLRERGGLRPYRILTQLTGAATTELPPRPAPLMMITTLGSFRCVIDGREVVFARRRDAHVVAYVALAPEGRVSREALMNAFWPGIDRSVAAPALRTTLSRVRRAIAQTAPGIDAEQYFLTAGDVRIDLRTVSVDARRFNEHIEEGRFDDLREVRDAAKNHYRIAQRIYADRLLASEGPVPPFVQLAETYEARYLEALTRLVELHAAEGDLDVARDYLRTLLARNNDEAGKRALGALAPTAATA